MDTKSYAYGVLTVMIIASLIFGYKQLSKNAKQARLDRKELLKLRDQNAELQKDTANYRKLLREASLDLNSRGCSPFYTTENYKKWEN